MSDGGAVGQIRTAVTRLSGAVERSVLFSLRRRIRTLEEEVRALEEKVRALEEEVQECRRLNHRIAELTDIVTELLVPIAQRDEPRVRELLDQYRDRL